MSKQEINVVNTHGQNFHFEAHIVHTDGDGRLYIFENVSRYEKGEPLAVFNRWDSWRFIQSPR